MTATVRIGALGAARIAPMALIRPARKVPEAEVVAIAARDPERARAFAAKHHVGSVYSDYDALIGDPDIDAVYVPLPNSLHAEWTLRALEAGKHVLCEKPLTANAAEAALLAASATQNDRVLMEAFHYRYHPLASRMREIVDSGDLGEIEHIEAQLCIPLPKKNDIRYRFDLAGGAMMDVGCYVTNIVRYLAGAEPEVTDARAALESADVDRQMRAEYRFPDGRTGRIFASMWGWPPLKATAMVRGTRGTMHVLNPVQPRLYHHILVRTLTGQYVERTRGEMTYVHQLRAFCEAIRNSAPFPTTAPDAIANMRVIDAVYAAAGLSKRGA